MRVPGKNRQRPGTAWVAVSSTAITAYGESCECGSPCGTGWGSRRPTVSVLGTWSHTNESEKIRAQVSPASPPRNTSPVRTAAAASGSLVQTIMLMRCR